MNKKKRINSYFETFQIWFEDFLFLYDYRRGTTGLRIRWLARIGSGLLMGRLKTSYLYPPLEDNICNPDPCPSGQAGDSAVYTNP